MTKKSVNLQQAIKIAESFNLRSGPTVCRPVQISCFNTCMHKVKLLIIFQWCIIKLSTLYLFSTHTLTQTVSLAQTRYCINTSSVPYVGRGLATGRPLVQGVLPTAEKNTVSKPHMRRPRFSKNCRATGKEKKKPFCVVKRNYQMKILK
jgi:hypothetical protein